MTVSAASLPASVAAPSSAAPLSSAEPPQAARDRHRVRPSSRASSFFFMFRSSNKISFMMYFKRLPDFQETNDENAGGHLVWAKRARRSRGPDFLAPDGWSSRLSMRRDSQLKISWTTCTRIIRNTTVTHITEVMPR